MGEDSPFLPHLYLYFTDVLNKRRLAALFRALNLAADNKQLFGTEAPIYNLAEGWWFPSFSSLLRASCLNSASGNNCGSLYQSSPSWLVTPARFPTARCANMHRFRVQRLLLDAHKSSMAELNELLFVFLNKRAKIERFDQNASDHHELGSIPGRRQTPGRY